MINNAVATLFSVPIHKTRLSNVIHTVLQATRGKFQYILLPMNIHILTSVAYNPFKLKWYTKASCIFADGVPLLWLCKLKRDPLPERVSGTDIVESLLFKGQKIFLLGSTKNILHQMQNKYNKNKHVPIVGTYSPSFNDAWSKKELKDIITEIKKSKAQIVLVGVGHPKQEQWIIENYSRVPAKIFIGVGSAFDILSGIAPRAPFWIQSLGLEWVWRIILEPRRLALRYAKDAWLLIHLLCKHLWKNHGMKRAILLISTLFLVATFFAGIRGGTVQYRADMLRTGFYFTNIFSAHPKWWRIKTNGLLTCAPVVANGMLYVSSWESNTLFAYDALTGVPLWTFVAQADLPFSPVIFRHIAYIGSVDGRVYALNEKTGAIKWTFESENRKSFTSHPLIADNKVIIGSRDGNLYALDWKTGRQVWKFNTGSLIESSPAQHKGVLYFGSFDGKVYGVTIKDGKKVWEHETKGKILSSPALSGNTLVIGNNDTFVYAFDVNNKSLLWKTQVNGPVDATPAIAHNSVYISSLNNKIYALKLSNGKTLWDKYIPTGAHAGFAVDKNVAYFGSTNNSLYALHPKTGDVIWSYQTIRPITSAPTINGNTIFVTSGWYVHALDKRKGKPYNDPSAFVLNTVPKKASQFEPIELSIKHSDDSYENPWNEASVSAVFVSENKTTMNIDGFYYDRDEWRIRFAPPKLGKWKWTVFVRPTPTSESFQSGSFVVLPSDNPGFIQISKDNPLQFMFSNGTLFHPVGMGDTILDKDNNGYPLDNFASDENNKNIHIREYAQIYGKNGAGFNLFRWSIDNAAFRMWESNYNHRSNSSMLWETYPVRYGNWGDELVQTLRGEGVRVWLTLWGFIPNVGMEKDLEYVYNQPSLESYIRYIVARYGAYVDVWELTNEATTTAEWIHYVAAIIKRLDPYHHPLTISYERPDLNEIDITAPHWYESEALYQSDLVTIQEINKYRKWNKPIVFGEQGNKYNNWDALSGVRMRVRLWTSFFNGASLIFWNTSGTKTYTSNKNANVYIGKNEREFVKAFSTFTREPTRSLNPVYVTVSNPEVRPYALQSDNKLMLYLFHFGNTSQTTTNVSFTLQKDANVVWINPENGKKIVELRLSAGQHIITSPNFTIDVALQASYND